MKRTQPARAGRVVLNRREGSKQGKLVRGRVQFAALFALEARCASDRLEVPFPAGLGLGILRPYKPASVARLVEKDRAPTAKAKRLRGSALPAGKMEMHLITLHEIPV